MKKLLAIVLAIATVLSMMAVLASCGNDGGQETEAKTEKATTAETKPTAPTETEKPTESQTKKPRETRTQRPTEPKVYEYFDIVKLAANTAGIKIDGDVDEVYMTGDPLFCGVEECKQWQAAGAKFNAGIVGDKDLATSYTNDDFSDYFYFAYDDTYLYICEFRIDKTPNYTSNNSNQPYAGDGSLIWFVNNDVLVGGIQWNAAVLGENAGENRSEEPVFGWFTGDNQQGATIMNWESKRQQFADHYCLEVKIPLADMGISATVIDASVLGFTFCTVDIVNSYDGNTGKLWSGIGYQLQYPGVNTWGDSHRGKPVNEPDPALAAANAAFKEQVKGLKMGLAEGGTPVKQKKFDTPIDVSAATKLVLTFEASGPVDFNAVLSGNGQIEITSSGACDEAELHYDWVNMFKSMTLDDKNQLTVELEFANGKTDGNKNPDNTFDPTQLNFFRWYNLGQTAGDAPTLEIIDCYFA